MPSLSENDRANLSAGLDAVRKIEQFTLEIVSANAFYEDELVFDATLMNFVVIGEVVEKLSQEFQNQFPESALVSDKELPKCYCTRIFWGRC